MAGGGLSGGGASWPPPAPAGLATSPPGKGAWRRRAAAGSARAGPGAPRGGGGGRGSAPRATKFQKFAARGAEAAGWTMNVFRILGDLSHLLAMILLLGKIWRSKCCAGKGRPGGRWGTLAGSAWRPSVCAGWGSLFWEVLETQKELRFFFLFFF
jgi:hypothetical protein